MTQEDKILLEKARKCFKEGNFVSRKKMMKFLSLPKPKKNKEIWKKTPTIKSELARIIATNLINWKSTTKVSTKEFNRLIKELEDFIKRIKIKITLP